MRNVYVTIKTNGKEL